MTDEITTAIDAASIVVRESDDDGPRVAVMSPSLGGSFFFDESEALKRIRRAYPEASADRGVRAMRHLRNRVRLALSPIAPANRGGGWVHGWRC